MCLTVRNSQGRRESQDEMAAGGRHQQMVCRAAGDGEATTDKDTILDWGQPPRPFCRSSWPSWMEMPLTFCQAGG